VTEQITFHFKDDSPLRRRYEAWRQTEAGETTYALCRRYALEKLERGQAFGIAALFERVRWDAPFRIEKDDAGYRLNNDFRSLVARELIREMPSLANLIETREMRSEIRRHREYVRVG
jgi:hypothetical protein